MPENHNSLQPHEGEHVEKNEVPENAHEDRFESDTQKIVRKHLENKDHVITDEDIASVRVGMVPPEFDAATEARFEDRDAREQVEDRLLNGTDEMSEDKNLDEGQITPWDTIDPAK